jgi:hypothetical protein
VLLLDEAGLDSIRAKAAQLRSGQDSTTCVKIVHM